MFLTEQLEMEHTYTHRKKIYFEKNESCHKPQFFTG